MYRFGKGNFACEVTEKEISGDYHRPRQQTEQHHRSPIDGDYSLQSVHYRSEDNSAEGGNSRIVVVHKRGVFPERNDTAVAVAQKHCSEHMHKQHYFNKKHAEVSNVFGGDFYCFACKQKGTAHNYGYHKPIKRHSETSHEKVCDIFQP